MASGKPVVVAIAADTRDFKTGIDAAKGDLGDLGDTATREGGKVGSAMAGIGESADGVASASSQAAGGLGDLGGALSLMPGPLGALGTGMETAAPAIMGLTGASDLLNLATTKFPGIAKVASAGARGLGLAMQFATGPIGLVVLAAAALTAGLILAYKKSETFRDIVNGAFEAVKKVLGTLGAVFKGIFDDVSKWLGKAWDYISGLPGKIGGAVGTIKADVGKIGGAFKDVYDDVTKWLGKAWDFISTIPGKITGAFSGIWSGLAGGLKSAINSVLHLPLTIPTIDTHIPGVGTVGGQTLIPALANGGVVTGPTLALIGEAGPEAVIPLNRAGGLGTTVNNYISVTVAAPVGSSPADVGRTLSNYLKAYVTAGGKVALS